MKLPFFTNAAVSGFDPNTNAFILAAGITNPTQQNAINSLVISLKTNNLWDKMVAIYPIVGGTASSHSYNLKNTTQFQVVWSSGWTHSSTGALPNGGAYANTNLTPSVSLGLNDTHISIYSRTNNSVNAVDIGTDSGGSNILDIEINFGGRFYTNNSNYAASTSNTGTAGLFTNTRTSSGSYKGFKNNVLEQNNSVASVSQSTKALYFGARNNNGTPNWYTTREIAFVTAGNGLTDSDVSNFYTIVQAYQTRLGRQV